MTSDDRQRARTRLAESTATHPTPSFRALAFGGFAVAAVALGLALVWLAPTIALVLVAGLLLGLLLDGLVRALDWLLPVSRATRYGLVVLTLASLAYGGTLHGGRRVQSEVAALRPVIELQASTVRAWLQARGVAALPDPAPDPTIAKAGPASSAFSPYSAAIRGTLGSFSERLTVSLLPIATALAVLMLGLSLAARPSPYRDTLLRLAPPRQRWRAARFVDGATESVRGWLVGRLGSMIVVFGATWAGLNHLGIQNAMSLALAAALAAFVPVVGPLVVAGLIGLAALAGGAEMALGALAIYLAIVALDRFIVAPLVRWRRTDLSLATILAGQLVLGALLGPWGLVLAVPVLLVLEQIAGEVALAQDEPTSA